MRKWNDKAQAKGAALLVVFVVVLGFFMAMYSGAITVRVPGVATDRYEEIVNRDATDWGMKVPLHIKVTFDQNSNTDDKYSDLNVKVEQRHEAFGSDENYVPGVKLIDTTNFDDEVGNQGDIRTIYAVNGNSILASNKLKNTPLKSISNINFGFAQNNYKAWTQDTTPTPSTSDDNGGILVTTVWEHYAKGTNRLLSTDTVTFLLYYTMPDYDADQSYEKSYTFDVYVPFTDYKAIEDIKVSIFSFVESCKLRWKTVTTVTHTYWDFPNLNKYFPGATGNIKLVQARDVSVIDEITYDWKGPTKVGLDNSKNYGSHSYTYKIR